MTNKKFALFLFVVTVFDSAYDVLLEKFYARLSPTDYGHYSSGFLPIVLQLILPAVIMALIAWFFGIWNKKTDFVFKIITLLVCAILPILIAMLYVYFSCYFLGACI